MIILPTAPPAQMAELASADGGVGKMMCFKPSKLQSPGSRHKNPFLRYLKILNLPEILNMRWIPQRPVPGLRSFLKRLIRKTDVTTARSVKNRILDRRLSWLLNAASFRGCVLFLTLAVPDSGAGGSIASRGMG
jgi:hypothetical protein